jgi:hypothetical protein
LYAPTCYYAHRRAQRSLASSLSLLSLLNSLLFYFFDFLLRVLPSVPLASAPDVASPPDVKSSASFFAFLSCWGIHSSSYALPSAAAATGSAAFLAAPVRRFFLGCGAANQVWKTA